MTSGAVLLAFLTLQRLSELVIATRNTKSLLLHGAYERGAGHYPAMVALHATWLASLWFFGWNHPASAPFVAAFALLQSARLWVLLTLGRRWTTRIIIAPGLAPVTSGPFRFVRHPNYLVVARDPVRVARARVGLARSAVRRAQLRDAVVAHSRRGPRVRRVERSHAC